MLNKTEPLGLPTGSVRAIITLVFTGVTAFLFATQQPVPDGLLAIDAVVVYAYYQKRQTDQLVQGERLPQPTTADDDLI